MSFVVTITSIRSFQVFDTVEALTRGGPSKSTYMMVYAMFEKGIKHNLLGDRLGHHRRVPRLRSRAHHNAGLLRQPEGPLRMTSQGNWFSEFLKHALLLLGARYRPAALLSDAVLFAEIAGGDRKQYRRFHRIPGDDDGPALRQGGTPEAECKMRPIVYNYKAAFSEAPLLRYMLNGVFVTISIFLIQVLVALPCAYALAKLRFWGRDVVFGMVIFCLLIPVHAIALPLYIMLAKVGLTNTYAALVIPWTISVFGIFLMRQFFKTVPDDLIDAARMDGMSEFGIVWKVMLPTAIPALLAFAIFSVVAHWNDYYWPRVVITGDRDLMTPPLGLRMFKSDLDGNEYGPMMAATTVIVMPLVVAFLLAQRRFIEGHHTHRNEIDEAVCRHTGRLPFRARPETNRLRPELLFKKIGARKGESRMKFKTVLAATVACSRFLRLPHWRISVTIEVGYPYSALFDVTFKRMMPLFKKAHPDIDVKFRATYDNYEDATNTILREAVADKLPDVTFQGLNRQAALVEKGIAKSLGALHRQGSRFLQGRLSQGDADARHLQRQGLRAAFRRLASRRLLQHDSVEKGRHHDPAQDLGRGR